MKRHKIYLTILLCLVSIASYAWDYECMVNDGGNWVLFQWNGSTQWGVTGNYHIATLQSDGTYGNHIWGSGGNSSVLEGLCEPNYQ